MVLHKYLTQKKKRPGDSLKSTDKLYKTNNGTVTNNVENNNKCKSLNLFVLT